MTKLEYKEESSDVIDVYYDIYLCHLEEGLIDVEDTEKVLQELEDAELYLECAGVFKAMNNYKAVKDEEFSKLMSSISRSTE
tara:strand:+ start:1019 stop:1264 length:246 start_codon:yes stop_codon:yes gene_type:complete